MTRNSNHQGLPRVAAILCLTLLLGSAKGAEPAYDPLKITRKAPPTILDRTIDDQARDRKIPVRIYLPVEKLAAPVILFSHGLGGSCQNNPYLGEHWSGRGYVVVYMQHAGSDETVWKDQPLLRRIGALQQAANLENTLLRIKDVSVVIDSLERWNSSSDPELSGRLDLRRLGMSGHSFGAITTQWVSGQTLPRGNFPTTEARIKAALAMSPSTTRGADPKESFRAVKIPWLLMTGTEDTSIIGAATVESRLEVFPALPPGRKYELVLDGGAHEAFSDRDLPGTRTARNPNHHRVILAISTGFWDAMLREDPAALKWLDGEGPRSVMEEADRWQKK